MQRRQAVRPGAMAIKVPVIPHWAASISGTPLSHGRAIQQHAFRERRRAGDDQVGPRGQGQGFGRAWLVVDGLHGHRRVERAELPGEFGHPRLPDRRFAPQHLAVEVGGNERAAVGDDHPAHARHHQGLRGRAADPAHPGHQHGGVFQPLLPLAREHARADLPLVACPLLVVDFRGGHGYRILVWSFALTEGVSPGLPIIFPPPHGGQRRPEDRGVIGRPCFRHSAIAACWCSVSHRRSLMGGMPSRREASGRHVFLGKGHAYPRPRRVKACHPICSLCLE